MATGYERSSDITENNPFSDFSRSSKKIISRCVARRSGGDGRRCPAAATAVLFIPSYHTRSLTFIWKKIQLFLLSLTNTCVTHLGLTTQVMACCCPQSWNSPPPSPGLPRLFTGMSPPRLDRSST
ncbi:hypothetical protein E2C01_059281 [Portunus trituberculatus]|uniref:Uncharacterized protein n=1 Tax=Portunus trituberculatus TaxID=210409 RepID=A0A5B7H240_PORTR|nr:hypothetical protein [Portunus trituberculatus]